MHDLQQLSRGFERNRELLEFLESGARESATSFAVNGALVAREDVLERLRSAPDATIADTFELTVPEPAAPSAADLARLPIDRAFAAPTKWGLDLRSGNFRAPSILTQGRVNGQTPEAESAAPPVPAPTPLEPPPHGYYPTVERDRFGSERIAALQRLINAAGYPEGSDAAPLVDDGDGGRLTAAGIDWLVAAADASVDDPSEPAFWQSVHAYAHGLEGETGDAARAALADAFERARTVEPPPAGYPTVRANARDSERLQALQRVINAAGYAELTEAEALDTDGDGGPLTRGGTEWLAQTARAPGADPNTPEFWNAVHTYAARLDGERGDTLRAALSDAIGDSVRLESRIEQGPVPAGAAGEGPSAEASVQSEDVRSAETDGAAQLPTVAADVRNDPRMERLQEIINAAGYSRTTGRAALVIDGTGGPNTTAGIEWLAEQADATTDDPNDPGFWAAVNGYAERIDGDSAEGYRQAVSLANAWANMPEAPSGGWPTVPANARNSFRFENLQRVVNAAGYADITDAAPLEDDGHGGPLSAAGIAWLAEHTGAPTADPNDPLFWGHLTRYAANAEGEHAQALREAVDAAAAASWRFDRTRYDHTRVQTHLPSDDPNISSYAPMGTGTRYQWGTERTIEMIRAVAAEYNRRTGYVLRVGDISQRGGGDIPGHASHEHGKNVDLDMAFNDDRTTIEPRRGSDNATWRSDAYDRDATRVLVQLLREAYPGIDILFNDPVLVREGLVRSFPNHDNHLHLQGMY